MIVLIPAYEPDRRLVVLVHLLRTAAPQAHVVVVDDGSGAQHAHLFRAAELLGATVLGAAVNRGKGAALKEGFRYVAENLPGEDVVCADCDGQHGVVDILRVAEAVRTGEGMVLGVRRFTGAVPLRSRFGNAVTRAVFAVATRSPVSDTQTGLRGYPTALLPWLVTVPGERFEYELNLLLKAPAAGHDVREVPIETIYLEGNASSHFRPVVDSARIYAPLLRFALSSAAAFALDTGVLLTMHALTGALLPSVVTARVVSSTVNFTTNRHLVFRTSGGRPWFAAAARYGALVVTLLTLNYLALAALTGLGLALLAAKVLTEITLFALSYSAQRSLVFLSGHPVPGPHRRTGAQAPAHRSRPRTADQHSA
ncbi:MAG TPA: GtrA family protein [Actinotalea sp.]|jgi:putative flippase GtrA